MSVTLEDKEPICHDHPPQTAPRQATTSDMNALAQRAKKRTPRTTDVVVTMVVVALTAFGLVFDWGGGDSDPNAIAAIIALLAAGAVGFRRRNPVAVLLAVAAVHLFLTWNTGNEAALAPATAVACSRSPGMATARSG